MKHGLIAAIAALALGSIGSTAQAAPVIFTLSGSWQGTFNGVAFTDTPFAFTGVGDTSNIDTTTVPDAEIIALDSASVFLQGFGTFALLNPTQVAHSLLNGSIDFHQFTPAQRQVLDVTGPAGLSLGASIGPYIADVEEITGDIIPTSGGMLQFQLTVNDTPITFSSQVYPDRTGGVPEPATWALLLTGFGGMGAALRRRRAQSAAVTA